MSVNGGTPNTTPVGRGGSHSGSPPTEKDSGVGVWLGRVSGRLVGVAVLERGSSISVGFGVSVGQPAAGLGVAGHLRQRRRGGARHRGNSREQAHYDTTCDYMVMRFIIFLLFLVR